MKTNEDGNYSKTFATSQPGSCAAQEKLNAFFVKQSFSSVI